MNAARLLIVFAVAGTTSTAHAHVLTDTIGGFWGGALHPLIVPAQTLCLIALALLMARHGVRARPMLALAFAAGCVTGIVLVTRAFAFAQSDGAVLACAAATGALVALGRPLPPVVAAAIMAAAGFSVTIDSVPAIVSERDTLLSLGGTLSSGLALVLVVGTALGAALDAVRNRWLPVAVRIAGSWLAASAILTLALRLIR